MSEAVCVPAPDRSATGTPVGSGSALGYPVAELAPMTGLTVDRLRLLLRRLPALRAMLVQLGGVRVLPAGMLEAFRAALKAASPGSSRNCGATAPASPPA